LIYPTHQIKIAGRVIDCRRATAGPQSAAITIRSVVKDCSLRQGCLVVCKNPTVGATSKGNVDCVCDRIQCETHALIAIGPEGDVSAWALSTRSRNGSRD